MKSKDKEICPGKMFKVGGFLLIVCFLSATFKSPISSLISVGSGFLAFCFLSGALIVCFEKRKEKKK